MVKSSVYPRLERKPGVSNWVDQTGGLPDYIERIAKHLHYERGMSIQHAIATAVNTVKRWARMGGVVKYGDPHNKHVTTITAAQAAKAVAEWEAKRARARALPGTPMPGRLRRRRSVGLSEAMLDVQALAERANAIRDPQRKVEARAKILDLAIFTASQRRQLAGSGAALGDGSFPIRNEQDLRNAIRAIGRSKNPAAAKRHIIQRARSLGLMNVLPESWRTVSMSVPIDLARRMTKDGRPSFKGNGGKYRHGFVPINENAVTAKAKGSPIAKRRIKRLYGGAAAKPGRSTLAVVGGGSATAKTPGQVRGAAIAKSGGQAPGINVKNTATDNTRSPVTVAPKAQRPWDAIPDDQKTMRNGKRYVVVSFGGKQKLQEWQGPAGSNIPETHNTRIAAISQRDAEQLTGGQLSGALKTKGKASQAARTNLNAALRKRRKAVKKV